MLLMSLARDANALGSIKVEDGKKYHFRQTVWTANNIDQDQTISQDLHCLPFVLCFMDAVTCGRTAI